MKQLKKIPEESLAKQISWLPEEYLSTSGNDENKSKLRIGVLASDRLARQLESEYTCITLTESNWNQVLKYGDVDFLLLESFFESAHKEFLMEQYANPDNNKFNKIIELAKKQNIPTVYWFTQSAQLVSSLALNLKEFDFVYGANELSVKELEKFYRISVGQLSASVAPKVFNPVRQFMKEKSRKSFDFVLPNLSSFISHWSDISSQFEQLKIFKMGLYDSDAEIWNTKTKQLDLEENVILGYVHPTLLPELYANANCMLIPSKFDRDSGDIEWDILQAISSRIPVVAGEDLELPQHLKELVKIANIEGEAELEIYRFSIDEIYKQRVVQKAWRKVLQEHTIVERVNRIANDLKISDSVDSPLIPRATFITPTYRLKFLERALKNFRRQNYQNKELIIVCNGSISDFEETKRRLESECDVKVYYMNGNYSAGPCLNLGIAKSSGEYVFRVDDDDFYGPNYLLDQMLYTKHQFFDAIGKTFKFFVMEDRFKGILFKREKQDLDYHRPCQSMSSELPKHTFLAGCTHGGRKEFFLQFPFPQSNYGAVDSQWIDTIREQVNATIICADDLNLVVDRRTNNDHTWKAHEESIIKNSRRLQVDKKWVTHT